MPDCTKQVLFPRPNLPHLLWVPEPPCSPHPHRVTSLEVTPGSLPIPFLCCLPLCLLQLQSLSPLCLSKSSLVFPSYTFLWPARTAWALNHLLSSGFSCTLNL